MPSLQLPFSPNLDRIPTYSPGRPIDEVARDDEVRKRALEAIEVVATKIPQTANEGAAPLADDIGALMEEARALVLARLAAGEAS